LFVSRIRSIFIQEGSIQMKIFSSASAVLATAIAITLTVGPAFAGPDRDRGQAYGYHGLGHARSFISDRGWDRGDRGRPDVVHAPEIDAASGLAALAAVFGALAFARERRRHG
jgi:hypothetical protein